MKRLCKDWITSYLEYTENTEPPEIYREWTAISIIAAALRRKCYKDWGHMRWFPNLYIVLVGSSGVRKSTAMSDGQLFLNEQGLKVSSEATTKAALIQQLISSKDGSDPTEIAHNSLTIFSKELTVFLGYGNAELMAHLADWFDCDSPWSYITVGGGAQIVDAVWVNILGATTPHLIRSALPIDAIGGGLASRIIFVYASRKGKLVPLPSKVDNKVLLRNLKGDYGTICGLKGEFTHDKTFEDGWDKWYREQDANPPFPGNNALDGYTSRRPLHLMKLCMVLSASEGNRMKLTGKILDRGIDLLDRTEKDMPKVFSGIGASRYAEVLARMLDYVENNGFVTESDLARAFSSDIEGVTHLRELVETMVLARYVKKSVRNSDGIEGYRYNRNRR